MLFFLPADQLLFDDKMSYTQFYTFLLWYYHSNEPFNEMFFGSSYLRGKWVLLYLHLSSIWENFLNECCYLNNLYHGLRNRITHLNFHYKISRQLPLTSESSWKILPFINDLIMRSFEFSFEFPQSKLS